ncbi:hypothetical protein [Halobellus marinus]|jgi:hypothetical protein|uniref:hypothetical protein n=1 Tax=Halobellus TaxID=1073986 RepID=UPI0028AA2D97|nr:hypothetical protein [Halobellus sp. DFY28]
MLLRVAALVIGILELLAPRKVVDFWMSLAAEGDVDLRSWVYTAARIEGVALVVWALTRGRSGSGEA